MTESRQSVASNLEIGITAVVRVDGRVQFVAEKLGKFETYR
jgi:hypothetical protein